jgi:hypothetical protein
MLPAVKSINACSIDDGTFTLSAIIRYSKLPLIQANEGEKMHE